MIADVTRSLGTDFYLMDELLTEDERRIRDTLRAFCDTEVIPVVKSSPTRAQTRSNRRSSAAR